LDKDQKYTIGYSFKNKMGISANIFVLLELIKDGSIMYTRKLQDTEATTFDYTAPATGEYTWRMRSSSIGTTTTQPITYSLDNLSIIYSYPYTLENCDNLADGYRFGFNGKEKDDEVYGAGNLNTAMFWEYDTRLGRRWNLDPKPRVGISDYSVMDGNPILLNDILGDDPTKKEAWAMSKVVYGKNDKATARARKILERGGWAVSKQDFGIIKNTDDGFKSEIFQRTDKEGTEFAYATAGTDGIKGSEAGKDWKNNGTQLLGLSSQYDRSTLNASLIKEKLGTTELTFTGHSLGGGMAAANAYATGGKAITFNPAGVSLPTMSKIAYNYGFKMAVAKIDAYYLMTDPLNRLQNFHPLLPNADGKNHTLPPMDLKSVLDGHSLDNLGKSLGIK
jgi:hypothetical protein